MIKIRDTYRDSLRTNRAVTRGWAKQARHSRRPAPRCQGQGLV